MVQPKFAICEHQLNTCRCYALVIDFESISPTKCVYIIAISALNGFFQLFFFFAYFRFLTIFAEAKRKNELSLKINKKKIKKWGKKMFLYSYGEVRGQKKKKENHQNRRRIHIIAC